MHEYSLKHLSDADLTRELKAAVGHEQLALASLLAHIAEFDARELYLPAGCASMYRYSVDRLHLSEDAAAKRIQVARVARQIPEILEHLAAGRIHLSGLVLLAPRLTRANAAELLAAAAGRPKAEIEVLLAERFPMERTAVFWTESSAPATEHTFRGSQVATDVAPALRTAIEKNAEPEHAPGHVLVPAGAPIPAPAPAPQARVRAIAPGRFELMAVLDQETHDLLMQSRDLLGHAVPSGNLADVLARAIALQNGRLRRRRCAGAARPRAGAGGEAKPDAGTDARRIPAAIVRTVWQRDGGRCTFVGEGGHRCAERSRLELDHVVPVARGGQATVENLRLLCRAHNRHAAERALGREHVRTRREAAQNRRAAERHFKQRERERAEKRKAEIERQRDELGEAFRQLGYRGPDLERALAHCATRPEASLEERLKHALRCMAPRALKQSPAPNALAPPAPTAAA